MNDDDLGDAFARLASALTPPADTVARVAVRAEHRRRRRTTSLAVLSVVAVLGGGGIASAMASGTDGAAPMLGHGVATPAPSADLPDLPVLPTQVMGPSDPDRPLGDDTLTYDPHLGTLESTPALPTLPTDHVFPPWLEALRCHGGVDVRRSFAAILLGGSPSIHGAVADQVRRSDTGLDILKNHADSAVVFTDGPDGKRRVRLEVVHGFRGWVWITRRVCD